MIIENAIIVKNLASQPLLWAPLSKAFSTSMAFSASKNYKLVVLGGGAGGCSTAAKFVRKLGKGQVAVVEPGEEHYYQPMWTMVGGGFKSVGQSCKPMGTVLPKAADWFKAKATKIDAEKCKVLTSEGDELSYEYLVIAVGLQNDFKQIKGLPEALDTPGVCTNFSPKYAAKTHQVAKDFRGGNALFTFPKPPIKCPGAPQKIMYITERAFEKAGKRSKASVQYHTSLPVLFGVKKYADSLWEVVKERGIDVHLSSNLVEVNPDRRVAIFENLDDPAAPKKELPYEMLHVAPPMVVPDVLKNGAPGLVNEAGFVEVNKETLRHVRYPNVFALGDCSDIPCSKTAAAVAAELGVLKANLSSAMEGKHEDLPSAYDGYASCPLVLGPGQCILAEFDFSSPPVPLETFPINQAKSRWIFYAMKKHIMPSIYWQMLQGRWNGPKIVRKLMHLGMSR